jgi:long-chain acyl-CoA synthetase
METQLVGGITKILEKGTQQPEAVRYHVPRPDGSWRQVSWGELLQRSRQIALYLDREGIGKDHKVSIFATTRLEWAFCCPAIEACRGVFVPVYFSNTAAQAHYVVDHSDAEILFTELALLPRVLERWRDYRKVRQVIIWDLEREEQLAQAILGANLKHPGLDLTLGEVQRRVVPLAEVYRVGEGLHQADPERLARMLEQIDEADVAAIIYTSGTTGDPKGVVLTLRNLISSTLSWYKVLEHAFPPEGERRDILWLPISHMSGWGIMGQGTLFDYETWFSDPLNLLRILPEVKPTMLLSVPAYWEKMYTIAVNASTVPEEQHAKLHEITGGKLSFLLSGGAGLKREVKEFFNEAGIQMIEGYGLTECAPNLTMNRLDDFDFGSVGKPVPDVTIQLATDGEILVKGDNVFPGYYKDPEATAEVFDAEGWFRTGDLGEWTDRGFLRFLGRKKEIIVTSGGKNISPGGIEARFAGRPFVEHVVLYGNERKYLVALITLDEPQIRAYAEREGIEGSHAELVQHPGIRALVQHQVDAVNAELASYETIKSFYLYEGHLSVEAGQLTPSLKLRRARVWEDFGDRLEVLYAGKPPRPVGRAQVAL